MHKLFTGKPDRHRSVFVRLCCVCALLFHSLALVREGASHPHIWVEYSIQVHFTDKGLAGFTQQWRFDEMFSNELISMHGLDPDRNLTESEIALLRGKAFQNLRDYNYFTQIHIDGKPFEVKFVSTFNAWIDGRNMVYEFFVPCTVTAIRTPKTITLLVFDTDFFVDLTMDSDNPVSVKGNPLIKWHKEIAPDSAFRFFGFLNPPVITLQFWKTP